MQRYLESVMVASAVRSAGLILTVGAMASMAWMQAPASAHGVSAPCSGSARATFVVSKSATTTFQVDHGDDFSGTIDLTTSGCRPVPRPNVSIRSSNGQDSKVRGVFLNTPDAYAVRLAAKNSQLTSGKPRIQVVISGRHVNTLVIPVTIRHQYDALWFVLIIALISWAIGLWVAAARAVTPQAEGNVLAGRKVLKVLRQYPLSAALTIGAAYGMFATTYSQNHVFAGDFKSLAGLAIKILAGAAATHVFIGPVEGAAKSQIAKLRS